MTLLSAHALGKHFGERRLFEGVTFDVGERDKIGLVPPQRGHLPTTSRGGANRYSVPLMT